MEVTSTNLQVPTAYGNLLPKKLDNGSEMLPQHYVVINLLSANRRQINEEEGPVPTAADKGLDPIAKMGLDPEADNNKGLIHAINKGHDLVHGLSPSRGRFAAPT